MSHLHTLVSRADRCCSSHSKIGIQKGMYFRSSLFPWCALPLVLASGCAESSPTISEGEAPPKAAAPSETLAGLGPRAAFIRAVQQDGSLGHRFEAQGGAFVAHQRRQGFDAEVATGELRVEGSAGWRLVLRPTGQSPEQASPQ